MPGPYTSPSQFDSANINVFAWANRHVQVRYLGPSGVSLHPLQRAGIVPAASHDFAPMMRQGAAGVAHLGDAPPAGMANNASFPPMIQIAGSPRDPRVMI